MPGFQRRSRRSQYSQQPLGAWDEFGHAWILPAGCSDRPSKSLEQRFDLVMVRAAIQYARVHGSSRTTPEPLKEVVHQFCLQIPYKAHTDLRIDGDGSASAKIHGGQTESFVHRHKKIAGPQDTFLVAQGLIECFSQHDPGVLHRVMLIDIQIASGTEVQIKGTVMRKQFQHVIEESNSSRDLVLPLAVDVQTRIDIGLLRGPVHTRLSHPRTS